MRTSVCLPPEMVADLDRVAAARGVSRNRVILQACEALLAADYGSWPEGFFDPVNEEDLAELRAGGLEMEAAIRSARQNRD